MNSVDIFYEDIQPLLLQKKHVNKLLKSLIISEIKKQGMISFIFCSDEYLLKINKQYLDHDYYTDIITFDYVEKDQISGDLFISIDRVRENAKKFKTEFVNELFRVMFHGVLHLIGYKDKTEEEKRLMREKENLYLSEVDFREIEV